MNLAAGEETGWASLLDACLREWAWGAGQCPRGGTQGPRQPPQLGPLSWGTPDGSKCSGVRTSGGRARAARGQGEGTRGGADGGGRCHQLSLPTQGRGVSVPFSPQHLGLARLGGREQNWPTEEP